MKGLRVLELGNTLATAYCGRLFAGSGADVVIVEPPEGGVIRSLGRWSRHIDASMYHEYLNAGKRSTVADSSIPSDEMLGWADIVVSSCDGDPERAFALHERIERVDSSVVHVVTSGYGLTGPYARWRSSPLLDWASGGYLYITGDPGREPVQGGGPWPSFITGATAAIAAQAAAFHAIRTGTGQLVDIGAMESVAAAHQWTLTMATHVGAIKGRWGERFGESHHPMSLYECADGAWILIGAPSREQWENFCTTVGAVEFLADESLYAPGVRFERANEIDGAVAPWLTERTAAEAVAELQANRVPASEVLDYAQVLEMEQLDIREFLTPADHVSAGAQMPGRPFAVADPEPLRRAPSLGTDTDWFTREIAGTRARMLPQIDLSRVRLAEFTLAWAGPLAGRFLGDLGVDVVKVEHPTSRGLGTAGLRPERSEEAWEWGQLAPARIRAEVYPDADPGERPWNRMGLWNKMNRCKRSLCLDAKAEGGDEVLGALVRSADIVIHNFTPRGARSLGISHDQLVGFNPDIVSVAMSGYGETGPMSTYSSYGPILEACAGVTMASGYPDQYPIQIGVALPDAVGGLHGAYAALAGLWEQRRSRDDIHIDLSQLETMLAFCGESLLRTSVDGSAPAPIGNRSIDYAPQGLYRCAETEDSWLALTVTDDVQWRALVEVAGQGLSGLDALSPAERRNRHDEIDLVLSAWAATRRASVAAAELQNAGVAACPVFNAEELVSNDHIAARDFMIELDHPDVGPRRFPGTPIHLSATPVELWPAPALGQHNDDVLDGLGYDPEEIQRLHERGVLAVEPPM